MAILSREESTGKRILRDAKGQKDHSKIQSWQAVRMCYELRAGDGEKRRFRLAKASTVAPRDGLPEVPLG